MLLYVQHKQPLRFSLLFVLLGAFAKLRKATISFVLSVCPSLRMEQLHSLWKGFELNLISEYSSKICRRNSSLTRITDALHEDQNTFLITSRSFLLRMRNISDKSCRENQNTHFMFNNVSSKIVPFMR